MDVVQMKEKGLEARLVRELQEGKVVAAPTDTVYGLIADAANKDAVQKVLDIKGREEGKPLPIFVRDMKMARELGVVEPEDEEALEEYWPGQVTAVVKSRGVLPKETDTAVTIGLRIPDHPLLLRVLEQVGIPLTGTSANLAGNKSLSVGQEVVREFAEREHTPDLVVDAGHLPVVLPSSVVDFTQQRKVLRRGSRKV